MAIDGKLAELNDRTKIDTDRLRYNDGGKPGRLGGIRDSVSGIQKNVTGAIGQGGRIVATAAGALGATGLAEALTGSSKVEYGTPTGKSGLKKFFHQFGGQSRNYVDRIDPMVTFRCSFELFPSVTTVQNVKKKKNKKTGEYEETKKSKKNANKKNKLKDESSVVATLLNTLKFRGMTFENLQATGQEDPKKKQVVKEKTETKSTWVEDEYDEDGNLVSEGHWGTETVGTGEYEVVEEDSKTSFTKTNTANLYIELGIYIQSVTLPSVTVQNTDEVRSMFGNFPVPGNIVNPDNNTIMMEVVNTKAPVLENVFYPWMRETTLPSWTYPSQPFTTAHITLDFTRHSNVKYHFFGCRPTQIQTVQPNQAPQTSLTRQVMFAFDFMTIEADLTKLKAKARANMTIPLDVGEKNGQSAFNLANSALFSATNTLKI